jgi:hypothetical protein
MKRIFAAVFALAWIIGFTPAFAAGGHGGGHAGGGMTQGGTMRGGMIRGGRVAPLQVPNMENRIPAPLAAPAQAPVINGPVGPAGLPPMGSAR